MKKLFYSAIILLSLASCKKTHLDSDNTPAPAPVLPGTVNYSIKDQVAKMTVVNATLKINYNEDITLLVDSINYQKSWAIIFNEDLKSTQLNNFNYTSLTNKGVYAYNWVDNNLNNVNLTSVKDTVINGVSLTKIGFSRMFLYSQDYHSALQAMDEYNSLLKQKDVIKYDAYLTFINGDSQHYTASANLTYIPGQ